MRTENKPVQESELKKLHSELRDPCMRDCASRYYTEKGAEAEIRRLARKTRPAVIEKLFTPDKCYTEGVTRPTCTYDGCGGSDDEPGATWVQEQEFAVYNLGSGQISLRKWWHDFQGEHLKQRMLEENKRSAARKDSIQADKKVDFE